MSETKQQIEEVNTIREVSAEEFFDTIQPPQNFVQLGDMKMKARSPNFFEFFRLVKEHPRVKALVVNIMDMIFDQTAKGDEVDVEAILALLKSRSTMDVFIECGDDAAAAFIAICLYRPFDKEFEKKIKSSTNDALLATFVQCAPLFAGGRALDVFFPEMLIGFEKMGMRRPSATSKRKPKRSQPVVNRVAKKVA